MSDAGILMGYIHEVPSSFQENRDPAYFRRANDAVIESLPMPDTWPPLSRSMFSATGAEHLLGGFRSERVIHFAGYLNHLPDSLDEWLDKFEGILCRMFWSEAIVHMKDFYACHPLYLQYKVPDYGTAYRLENPQPIQNWTVRGFHPNLVEATPDDWLFALAAQRITKANRTPPNRE